MNGRGDQGALLIAQAVYFVHKEREFLKQQQESSQKLITIITDTTQALTTISNNIEDLQKISEKLQNLGEQLRYLRLFLEKVMRVKVEMEIEE
jgi:hypothetical protein